MKDVTGRLLKWWTLAVFGMLAIQPFTAAQASPETPPHNCELYPIALSLHSVSNVATGAILSNLRNGTRRGQFGWLTWAGNRSRDTLVKSLTPPGDSYTYIDPTIRRNTNTKQLSIRDWVRATRSSSHRTVRSALDKLKRQDILVPVWYQVLSNDERATYRVAGFAKVRLLSYDLDGTDRISVQYLGMFNCDKGNDAPIVNAGDDQVIAFPAQAKLSGSVKDDGLPAGGTLTCAWSKVNGPGEVRFADPQNASCMATFSEPGTYLLRLWATDTAKFSTDEVVVTVNYANAAPIANSQTLATDEDVALNVTLTGSDPDGDAVTFVVLSNPSFGALSGTPPNLVYTPAPNVSGTDSFTFKLNDGVLDSAVATVQIDVAPVNDPPVAYTQSVSTDEDIAVAVTLAGSDAEGTALVFTLVDAPTRGVLSGAAPNLMYTPAPNFFGSDRFTFHVNDGTLQSAPAAVTLTVRAVNDPPVAQSDSASLSEDGTLDIVLRGSDTEGSPLTFVIATPPTHGTLSGAPPTLRYVPAANYNGQDSFTFRVSDGSLNSAPAVVNLSVQAVNDAPVGVNDSVALDEDSNADIVLRGSDVEGSTLTFSIETPPAHGTLNGAAPTLRYVPSANYHGSDSFTFTVSDGALNSAPATVSLTVRSVNDAPVAASAQVSLDEDTLLDIVLTGSDVEGSALTFSLISPPTHGTLSPAGAGPNVRYAPNVNYHGQDAFTFRVNDGSIDSADATVTVTVLSVNDVPVAASQEVGTAEDTSAAVTLSATDSDGDSLTFVVVNGPTHGSLSGAAPNLTYTPAANYTGSDSFQFRANDGAANSALATVTLTVSSVNDVPVATPQNVSTLEDNPLPITLSGTDLESSALNFAVTAQPAHGVLSGTAPNLIYTPNANYSGSDSFAFIVNDGSLDSTPAVVSIGVTPVNDAPVAHSQDVIAMEGESTPITLTGSDLDNDSLTFQVVNGPANGTLSGTPPNLAYTPAAGRPETDSFTFAVSDGAVNSALATVTIDIIYNEPPAVSAGPNRSVRSLADVVTLAGSVSDDGLPRNASLQVSWQMKFGPGTVTFGNPSSAVTTARFSTEGLYILELSASDSQYTSRSVVEARVAMICSASPSGAAAWWSGDFKTADLISGNEAVLESGTTYGPGKVGGAFLFDGVNDQIRVPASPSLDIGAANGLTIEFWMNSADVMRSVRLLGWHSGLNTSSQDQGVNIYQSAGNIHAQIYDMNSVNHEMIAYSPVANNVWAHVAVTYDRSTGQGRIYVDAVLRAIANLGNFRPRTTFPLFFGKILPNIPFYRGSLDEVTLYTRALDAEEIHEIYVANGTGKCPIDPNQPPVVDAGPDLAVRNIGGVALLNGSVSDDGLPAPASLRSTWSVVSGPGTVSLADAAALSTTATFSAAGVYVLRLTVDDTAIVRSDVVEVRVATLCTVTDPPGLVAWWPGNGNGADVAGGRVARLGSGVAIAAGRVGSAFSFDGVNDSARVTGDATLDVGAGPGFTIEFWMNSADINRNVKLVAFNSGVGNIGAHIGVNVFQFSGNLHVQIPDLASGLHEFVGWGTLTVNAWTHVAVTYDRSLGVARLYVNGVERAISVVGSYVARTAYDIYFGNIPFDVNHYRGLLDEVSLYNRGLNAQEVYETYSAGAAGKCPKNANQTPFVNAGPNLELATVSDLAVLNGQASDDSLPPGAGLRVNWSKVDGPGAVTFGDAAAAATTAFFNAPGIYVLSLAADDGAILRQDLVEVRVAMACSNSPSGLVAWWPGNANGRELAGGRDAHGANGATFASGRVSAAFSFDGVNDWVGVPAHAGLDVGLGPGFTVEFWVNPADVNGNGRLVAWHSSLGYSGVNFGVNLRMLGSTVGAQVFDLAGQPHDLYAFGVLANNTWTHLALTYDRTAGEARIYVNSVLRATAAVGSYTPRTSYGLFFGNVPFDAAYFRGLLDEISIYDRALGANEVADVFAAGAAGKCPPAPVGPTSLQELAGTATVTENENGQRIGMSDASGTSTYSYDAAGRLSRITKSWTAYAGAPAIETGLVYEYDVLGRFVGVHSSNLNGASMRYIWSDANRLLEVADPHSGNTVYHYDAAGSAVGYTYPNEVTGSAFGVLDNVACYDEPGAEIVCDADGNRVRRTVTNGSRTVTIYYVISPLTVTGTAQVVEELTFDSADPLFATAAVTRVYVHGLHTISQEELVDGEWRISFFE